MTHPLPRWKMPDRSLYRIGCAIVAIVAAAICVATSIGSGNTTAIRTTRQSFRAGDAVDHVVRIEAVYWEWPRHLPGAVGMFQCWPARERRTLDSVVVWTDRAGTVIAFGAAREDAPLPTYAVALRDAGAADASRPIEIADRRHVMRLSRGSPALQLGNLGLSCMPTWDD
jgi:hypothetical protein